MTEQQKHELAQACIDRNATGQERLTIMQMTGLAAYTGHTTSTETGRRGVNTSRAVPRLAVSR